MHATLAHLLDHPRPRPAARRCGRAALLGLALAGLAAVPGLARAQVELEIHDRSAGQVLPVWRHGSERWIAGEPGHEYELRLTNRSPRRVLAVVAVDGVNVVSGETAAPAQSGYVLEPWQSLAIGGWRKDLERVAAFRFTRVAHSYAARTGRPTDVGVIGVAVFGERARWRPHAGLAGGAGDSARAPAPVAPGAAGTAADAAAAAEASAAAARPSAPSGVASPHARAAGAGPPRQRLGTAHGRPLESRAEWTSFERASPTPEQLLTLRYDARPNLVARGIVPAPRHPQREPRPFPAGFVPDP